MKFLNTCHLLLCCLFFTGIISAQVNVAGLPAIKNYKRSDYKGGTQNWGIDQDKRGNLYFANNGGLFHFDGINWNKFELPNHSYVRSVKVASDGRIYAGGYNEFGYFSPDKKGALTYHSLLPLLPEASRKTIDFIWKIHEFNHEIVFQGFEQAFFFDQKKIVQLDAPNRFQFSFVVKDRLYFQDKIAGLFECHDRSLTPLSGTQGLASAEIWGIIAFKEQQLLIATQNKGVSVYREGKLLPWETEAGRFLKKFGCLGGCVLKDNLVAFYTVLDGLIICDTTGAIKQHINESTGLQNNTILTSFLDNRNNLWLGLDNGIDYLNINSPLTYFGHSYHISTVYASAVYKNTLYVATNQGLFYQTQDVETGRSTFALVKNTTGQAWNIQELDNQLFCSHNRGLLLVSGHEAVRTLDGKGYWGVKTIPDHANILMASHYNGFSIFEKKNGAWSFKNNIEGYNKSSNIFEIEAGSVWIVRDDQLYQLKLSNDFNQFRNIRIYKQLADTATVISGVRVINHKIYFQSGRAFYRFVPETGLFAADPKINALFRSLPLIRFLHQDSIGNIWYVFDEAIGLLKKTGNSSYQNIVYPFTDLNGSLPPDYVSVNTVDSSNVFIGLTSGLAQLNAGMFNITAPPPIAYIRSFFSSADSLFFANGEHATVTIPPLAFKNNSVRFSFSSPQFEHPGSILFSYKLEGFANQWSDWSAVSDKEYTNLHEGKYKMYLRTRNNANVISVPDSVAFSVSPPFYRHVIAYIIYVGLFLLLCLLVQYRIKRRIKKHKNEERLQQQKLYEERETKIRLAQVEMEKEIEQLQIEKLRVSLVTKDRELVNNSLQVVKKNKMLKDILQKIHTIHGRAVDEYTKGQLAVLTKNINKEVDNDKSWKELEKHIQSVHFDFIKRLKEQYPGLSSRDLDFSICLLLNMSSKEMAEMMNISSAGVELARYRLRKKLGLQRDDNLVSFFMRI